MDLFFGGWGNPQVPETVDDIQDWLKAYEMSHQKVPEWLYALLSALRKNSDQCQLFGMRPRTWNHSLNSVVGSRPYTIAEHHWTHWESAPYVPSNFIAIGDSVQCNNPMYGYVTDAFKFTRQH